ncbi:MAG TPA: integrase [Methylomirabilota bacterium]|nr:integrase [Methylomirabilota bacterium]
MSHITPQEVLAQLRRRYARAGRLYKAQLLDQAIELFGYHRKAAIRALRTTPTPARAPFVRGRPRTYDPDKLLPPLKAIWLAALQPCSLRLHACLPDWLPDYEADHRRLDPDVRQALLSASRPTLDRLLQPLRIQYRRRTTTRPSHPLRADIPIRTEWPEQTPGYLEVDTVALCGGCLDDRHGWMLDGVDIPTTWSVLRGLPNRSQANVCRQLDDIRAQLPFPLRGLDSDNGGEFINHQLQRYCQAQQPQILFTRSRAYKKNDQAHIEQKNFTQVRLWFGYERYDGPEVWPRVDALCRGPLHQLLNYCLPTLKLAGKQRVGSRVVRHYGPAQTPLARVLACAEVSEATKARLRAERAGLNALALRREVDRRLREIEAVRQWTQT